MKVTWEPDDITPGRRYSKKGLRERWIIGYLAELDGPSRYVSVSESDGMVTQARTKEEVARMLTQHGYLPLELL
jgi:hypothetical protein